MKNPIGKKKTFKPINLSSTRPKFTPTNKSASQAPKTNSQIRDSYNTDSAY